MADKHTWRFVTYGLLHEMTGHKRNRRFIYRDYIGLFHDEPGVARLP